MILTAKELIIMKDSRVTVFRPQAEAKASVVVAHGMAEHHERYEGLGKVLSAHGYAVYTYDLPGHGMDLAKEELGWFGKEGGWNNLCASAVDMMARARKENPGKPLVLFGHSMGTIIARCVLQDHDQDIDALILSGAPNPNKSASAGIKMAKLIRTFKGAHGYSKMLDNLVTGVFNKSIKDPRTPVDWLSYNTENVDAYMADPYDGFPFTIQGYIDEITGILQMSDAGRYHCTKKDLPILFFAGEEDPCIGGREGLEASQNVLKTAGYTNISAKLWSHMRHETMHEKDSAQVMEYAAEWLDAHI